MIYIDTSSLLKLVITDEHSSAVEETITGESVVLVSSLTALSRSGKMKPRKMNQAQKDLAQILGGIPFVSRQLKGTAFSDALQQHIEFFILYSKPVDPGAFPDPIYFFNLSVILQCVGSFASLIHFTSNHAMYFFSWIFQLSARDNRAVWVF